MEIGWKKINLPNKTTPVHYLYQGEATGSACATLYWNEIGEYPGWSPNFNVMTIIGVFNRSATRSEVEAELSYVLGHEFIELKFLRMKANYARTKYKRQIIRFTDLDEGKEFCLKCVARMRFL